MAIMIIMTQVLLSGMYIKKIQKIIELEDLRESNKEMRKLLDEVYAKMPHTNDCKRG